MKIWIDGVDETSSSGPNSFAIQLMGAFKRRGYSCVTLPENDIDVRLSFISSTPGFSSIPTVLRLDGVWFNTRQNWRLLNEPIKTSYNTANHVIVQSFFDLDLIEHYFGKKKPGSISVIHNSVDLDDVYMIPKIGTETLMSTFGFEQAWLCASHWRPHKRLSENVRYFHEFSNKSTCFLIAGLGLNYQEIDDVTSDRVFYLGELDRKTLVSYMKSSERFVHLAYLDHSPNVVTLARACDCDITCSISGGTNEIAGTSATVFDDVQWNFEPIDLYSPPLLDFRKCAKSTKIEPHLSIDDAIILYEHALVSAIMQ